MTDRPDDDACPVPLSRYAQIVLGHGSGGRLSADLLREVFLAGYGDRGPDAREDQAVLEVEAGRIAVTTDAFVVHPRFFPGGDIGALSIYGTVNDLAVGGARPRWIAVAFVVEEGLPVEELARIVRSMRDACERADVTLVTGDTKVVDRGKGDGVFVTTTGVGVVPAERDLSATHARPGDVILTSGTLGDHGMAIMSVREGLALVEPIESDAAPLNGLVEALLAAVPETRAMRDPTRGGVASALTEIAAASRVGMTVFEDAVPVRDTVRGACEILGLDPLYVANEGKLLALVPAERRGAALEALRGHPLGADAAVIGEVTDRRPGTVVLRTAFGTERVLPMLSGEQLPRIC
ncbi:MAG TPA: hydrogenase expression/formation protein HypE [Sandaracinaceae bacterium LLY-WYZ-13_1]|nr:hydrogenase expression/formation protein HypE [Sandaracinaceae bacterium LLY-WYZ-13_1]